MKRITHSSKGTNIARMLYKSFFVGTLAALSFAAGSIVSSAKADAQTPSSVNNNDIEKYSRALLTIEQSRLQAFEELKKISGQVPSITCNKPKTIAALPTRKARDIANKYCQRSQTIVKDSGLSIQHFNDITLKLQNDDSLKKQIHNALIRLQKKPNSR
ncbi:hypothetical protein Riv7116_3479 [Rivularia sp. PCC 7116]|uniref:DUF4168 domain-containing protein n=1 Tax=Rivularia sp. PCC 7116 TaxID=373994 RepID=UPI00029F0EF8|nr:DUF4168 domain-containing protein [Rivularia sp. PCC 7116]AFY55934.1 hypothetical protein Riv7116_3479 [Rivularia sp. PCC 7116]